MTGGLVGVREYYGLGVLKLSVMSLYDVMLLNGLPGMSSWKECKPDDVPGRFHCITTYGISSMAIVNNVEKMCQP